MDLFNSLMYQNSTLITSIIIVAALAYIGTIAISPASVWLRRTVGYLTSVALLLIGVAGFYFGASKEVTLVLAHVYTFDVFRIEWIAVGALAIGVGILLAVQSLRRM
ncbi:MAG TPA: hypothetical protein VE338_16085 [Ktedonobacterales bacterium]|jgi:hypothetical protein|nr:hypothetical protein [Ktedonobacterales bacterium]